jgi:hypothetical protein
MAGLGRRPSLVRLGLAVGVLLVVGGAIIGYRGYAATAGPDGAVRGYFAALSDSDASDALAYGDVPPGPHDLLTATVLGEQQRIAPITDFRITSTRRHGQVASVHVSYLLAFSGAPQLVHTTVGLHQHNGDWRLDRVAVSTQLQVPNAVQRATIAGGPVPDATTLLFPGVVPIRLDSPYLQLDATHAHVEFGAQTITPVDVQVSDAGRSKALAAADSGLLACLAGHGGLTCPQPSERYLPGSLRGTLATATPALTVSLTDSAAGVIQVAGTVAVIGSYRRLNFDNKLVSGQGRVGVPVRATAYATAPLRLSWDRP